ncbi:MAG TPA: hypothetical protein VEJ84_20285 [Acidimicrobiales bacterium]|nr:hypothetical protein [Acidimicrobiales bacterium]
MCLVVEPGLKRFWLEFDLPRSEAATELATMVGTGDQFTRALTPWALVSTGVGVTGTDVDECLDIVQKRLFGGAMPTVLKVVEDVDVSTLDEQVVLPNIEPPIWRGIWFPPGFSDSPMT